MIILPAAVPCSATATTATAAPTSPTTTTTTMAPCPSNRTSCLVSPQQPPGRRPSLLLRPPLDSSSSNCSNNNNRPGVSSVPLCFVKLPSPPHPHDDEEVDVWWPCFYLPRHSMMAHLHETLYMERIRKRDPDNNGGLLEQEMKNLQRQCSLDLLRHCRDVGRPVWLLMGRTSQTYPFCVDNNEDKEEGDGHHAVTQYLSVQDDNYVSKGRELLAMSDTNPRLKRALEEFAEYRTWTKSMGPTLTTFPLPPRTAERVPTTTTMTTTRATESVDSATVVTTASEEPASDDLPPAASSSPSPSSSTQNHKKRSTGRTTSHKKQGSHKRRKTTPPPETPQPRTPNPIVHDEQQQEEVKHASKKDDQDATPVTAHKRPTAEMAPPCTARKFNRQALEEAQRGPSNASPRSTRGLVRREVFPSAVASPIPPSHDAQEQTEPSRQDNDALAASPTPEEPVEQMPLAEPHEPTTNSTSSDDDEPPPLETEPEPLQPVDLPGRTVGEKLQSCLDVLRKENESVVGCRKIVARQRQILDFFNDVVHSRATHVRRGPKHNHRGSPPPLLPPIMHVCGAPGSGKTMTVEECGRTVTEQFVATCEDYQAPPKVVYLNCSHVRHMSADAALQYTLASAKVTERDLKNNTLDEDRKPVVLFVLDEIDYLVSSSGGSNHQQSNNKDNRTTKTEKYLQKLIEWAKNESYLVGLVGISNSVENEKAKRLEILGFPQENKVVFQTYDPEDLTYITLSRIGDTVVDASAITFLSKTIANSSGDARKHLEIVSRTISHLMESMTEDALNAEHQGPIVKLPHIKKMLNQSTTKTKDLLQASPSLDQHVLCLCMPLAGRVGSSPLPLKQLLWLLSECYGVVDIEGTSHLRSILERLVDAGLLKLKDKKKIAMDEIRFDEQLDEVESAVRDVLMPHKFYKDMATKLQSISLTLLL